MDPVKSFLNLTPRSLVYRSHTGQEYTWPKNFKPAKLSSTLQYVCAEESQRFGLSIMSEPIFHGVSGLPEDINLNIIVDAGIAQFLVQCVAWNGLILVPDTSAEGALYDGEVNIGCTRFSLYHSRIQQPL